jgi:hypothetical protein
MYSTLRLETSIPTNAETGIGMGLQTAPHLAWKAAFCLLGGQQANGEGVLRFFSYIN